MTAIALENLSPAADVLTDLAARTGVSLDLAIEYAEADYVTAGEVQQRICGPNGGMAFLRFSRALHEARDAGRIVIARWSRGGTEPGPPVIAPASESYPVRGASLASGIPYAECLAWVDAPDARASADAAVRIANTHGLAAWAEFSRLILAAWNLGHVRIRHLALKPDGCAR